MSSVILIFLALLAPVTVLLPAGGDLPCHGLPAEDCALYAGSADLPSSFALRYTLEAAVADTASLTASGEGFVVLPPDPADPLGGLALALTLDGVVESDGARDTGRFEVRLVDGMLYVDDGDGWVYQPLAGLAGTVDQAAAVAGIFAPFEALLPGYVTLVRGADLTVDGQPVAVFQAAFDTAGLFADPGFGEAFGEALLAGLRALGGGEMSEDELAELQMMLPALAGMARQSFRDVITSGERRVAAADGALYGFTLAMDLLFDPSPMAFDAGGSEAEPSEVSLRLDVAITGHGQPYTVEVPADAEGASAGF